MALDIWATIDRMVHLAAGRLSAARAAVESLPPPRTDRRDGAGHDPHGRSWSRWRYAQMTETCCSRRSMTRTTPTPMAPQWYVGQRRTCWRWRRGSATIVDDAMRWLGDDVSLFGTPADPPGPGSGDLERAGGRGRRRCRLARTCPAATDMLRAGASLRSRCSPRSPCTPAGYSKRDAQALVAAADLLQSSSRPLLYAAAAEDAGGRTDPAPIARTRRSISSMPPSTPTPAYEALADARRVGRELRRLGVERRIVSQPKAKTGWDSLTDSELKVVKCHRAGRDQSRRRGPVAPFSPHG